jgi:hypothetical protein
MSWFSRVLDLADKTIHTEGEDYILERLTQENGIAELPVELVKGEDYLTIRLRSFRIINVRKWTGRFYGSVQSRVHYLHESAGEAEYQKVIVPGGPDLLEMDAAHVDRVLVIDKPVLGPVPYLGQISLEIGLFSVKSTDLAAPYLKLLTCLAESSGVAAMGAARPYTEALRQGAELLFGNDKQASLEIGADKTWAALSTGTWLLMRAPKNAVDLAQFRLDDSDGRIVTATGAPYKDFPYLVFSVERSHMRDDWMTVPELKAAWAELADAGRSFRTEDAERLLDTFISVARWCPDLVPRDARRLAELARNRVPSELFKEKTVMAAQGESRPFPELEWLDLYGPDKG